MNAAMQMTHSNRHSITSPDPDSLKAVWANVAAPVGVVALADADGSVHGTTVTAFTSISFDPPLLIIALAHSSSFLKHLRSGRMFALNVMAHTQAETAASCATKAADKMAGVVWADRGWGPFIEGAAATLGCRVSTLSEAGDHVMVLAHIEHAGSGEPTHGLLYWQRNFACSSA